MLRLGLRRRYRRMSLRLGRRMWRLGRMLRGHVRLRVRRLGLMRRLNRVVRLRSLWRMLLVRRPRLTGTGRRDRLIGLRMRWLGRPRRSGRDAAAGPGSPADAAARRTRGLAGTRRLDSLIGLGRLARTLLVGPPRRLARMARQRRDLPATRSRRWDAAAHPASARRRRAARAAAGWAWRLASAAFGWVEVMRGPGAACCGAAFGVGRAIVSMAAKRVFATAGWPG